MDVTKHIRESFKRMRYKTQGEIPKFFFFLCLTRSHVLSFGDIECDFPMSGIYVTQVCISLSPMWSNALCTMHGQMQSGFTLFYILSTQRGFHIRRLKLLDNLLHNIVHVTLVNIKQRRVKTGSPKISF